MQVKSESDQVLQVIKNSKSLALITDRRANVDTVAAMLAFYHSFKSEDVKVSVIVPEEVPSECQNLPESSVITNNLGPKNLIISLDTAGMPLTKISYSQEGPVFNLVIHPKERSFEVERIRYSYEGTNFDTLVLFSVLRLSDLGDLYSKNQKELSSVPLINFDYRTENERYGSVNEVGDGGSLCGMIYQKFVYWKMMPNRSAAICLLKGLSLERDVPVSKGPQSEKFGPETVSAGESLLAKEKEALIQ